MSRIRKYICLAILAVLIVSVLAGECFAVPAIRTDAETILLIRYQYEGKAIPGATFRLYRVADVDPYCTFTAVSEFSSCEYTKNLNDNDQDSWKAMAQNLKPWVLKNEITPYAEGITDSVKGDIVFTKINGNMLTPGLYLMVGESVIQGEYLYSCIPSMLCMPALDERNNTWDYGTGGQPVIVKPKVERSDNPEKITLSCMKVWKDSGYKDKRPDEVSVKLLKNGKVYDTERLSAKNSWRYTWEDLPVYENGKVNEWDLDEVKVEHYRTDIRREGNTFVVTNTYEGKTPPGGGGGGYRVLPNTGLLWWPVPVLLGLGALFVLVSVKKRRKTEE